MAGRFNKILEFIGLVDDDQDEEMDRRQGAQTYNPSARRPQEPARGTRSAPGTSYGGYDDHRVPPSRYTGSSAARAAEYERYSAPRQADTARSTGTGYRSGEYSRTGTRADYERASARADYPGRASARVTDYRDYARTARPDDEFASAGRSYAAQDEFERTESQRPTRGNVVNMRGDSRHQTVIYYLHALEECRDVITDLLDNKTVLLNLEDMDERLIQRGIDTLCGAAFALNATLRKASDKTYLIAPNSVDVALTNDAERHY